MAPYPRPARLCLTPQGSFSDGTSATKPEFHRDQDPRQRTSRFVEHVEESVELDLNSIDSPISPLSPISPRIPTSKSQWTLATTFSDSWPLSTPTSPISPSSPAFPDSIDQSLSLSLTHCAVFEPSPIAYSPPTDQEAADAKFRIRSDMSRKMKEWARRSKDLVTRRSDTDPGPARRPHRRMNSEHPSARYEAWWIGAEQGERRRHSSDLLSAW